MSGGPGKYYVYHDRTLLFFRGADAKDLLQRLSTNDVTNLSEGPIQTVLTNEKGRIIDVLILAELGNGFLLGAGISRNPESTRQWVEKYVIMDDVTIEPADKAFRHLVHFDGLQPETTAGIRFVDGLGVHLFIETEHVGAYEAVLKSGGFLEVGEEEMDRVRVMRGIPGWPNELSGRNPLEARLERLVSWTKGCYIGQEVIARLDTYKKLQQVLITIDLNKAYPAPSDVIYGNRAVGTMTSSAVNGSQFAGLAFVKPEILASKPVLAIGSESSGVTAVMRE